MASNPSPATGLIERAARLSAPSPFNVPGSSVIQTDHLLLARDNLLDICDELAMGAFWGPAGVGKSYALLEAIGQITHLPVTWIEFGHRPTMRHVTVELLKKLGYDGSMGSKHDMIDPLSTLLQSPRLLVIDEAQRLNTECIDHLRSIHDRVETRFAIALTGGDGCWETLSKEPMLQSRIWRRTPFTPLEEDEVKTLMPTFHPVYKAASEELLLLIDRTFAHGLLRDWAGITKTLTKLMHRLGQHKLSERTIHSALAKHGCR
jgi:AAA domain